MTNTNYTPGPWEAMTPLGPGDYAVLSKSVNAGGNFHIATLPNGSHKEAKANARLIAAAPEMAEALADLVERCDGEEGIRADGSNIQTMRAHAVLAKAKGE